mmetsp:Transcript_6717/g.16107  ORF Transcript_6717/g.16107 Transcript_6717/m.16107 type:complete len:155 (-) Transcript_6717:2110-2574(-)
MRTTRMARICRWVHLSTICGLLSQYFGWIQRCPFSLSIARRHGSRETTVIIDGIRRELYQRPAFLFDGTTVFLIRVLRRNSASLSQSKNQKKAELLIYVGIKSFIERRIRTYFDKQACNACLSTPLCSLSLLGDNRSLFALFLIPRFQNYLKKG